MNLIGEYAKKPNRRVIGLMSGTSADGVDAAVVRVWGSGESIGAEMESFLRIPYEPRLRDRVLALCEPGATAAEACRMNFELGRTFAEAALAAAKQAGREMGEVDLIASHGQTICHLPPGDGEPGSTLQIGEPAVIAELTGVTVVADFRPRDMAAGGQGAPLVPYADYALFHHAEVTRAIQNIGGIANVTLLPAGGKLGDVLAFDTGPGNVLIDGLVAAVTGGAKQFDEGGAMARAGRVHEGLLGWLMEHEFVQKPPPKSTGREEFGGALVREMRRRGESEGMAAEDLVATATAFTAESIAFSYRSFLPSGGRVDEVILGGGGSYNAALREMLADRLLGVKLLTHEDFGISSDGKEALAFAMLGNETMLGQPANVPGATGARRAVVLGKIVPA